MGECACVWEILRDVHFAHSFVVRLYVVSMCKYLCVVCLCVVHLCFVCVVRVWECVGEYR